MLTGSEEDGSHTIAGCVDGEGCVFVRKAMTLSERSLVLVFKLLRVFEIKISNLVNCHNILSI